MNDEEKLLILTAAALQGYISSNVRILSYSGTQEQQVAQAAVTVANETLKVMKELVDNKS